MSIARPFFRTMCRPLVAGADELPAATATDVFLLAGQSNMVGRAGFDGGAGYPETVLQYDMTGALVPAVSPLDHHDEKAGDMGLALQFARDRVAASPGRQIVLVPAADGGTGFSTGHWTVGGARYAGLVARANALFAANPAFRLAGILWHQGESDPGNAGYAAALDAMIAGLRSDIAAADDATPFILGELAPDFVAASAANAAVNAIIADTPNRVPHTAVAGNAGTTDGGDNVHFDAASLRLLGSRYHAALAVAQANGPRVPAAVADLAAAAGDGQVVLSWSAPASAFTPVTDYVLQRAAGGGAWSTLADGVSAATGHTDGGLANGTAYSYRVAAVNAVGQGGWSAVAAATPSATATAPAAVSGLTAVPGDGQVALAWPAPADGGSAITDYTVERSTDGATWSVLADGISAATGHTDAGLANGTAYSYRVRAVNGVGPGGWSATATATPAGVPAAIADLAAAVGDGQVVLSWSAPAANGAAISDYVIERSPDGTVWTSLADGISAATGYTDSGLTNGTAYHYRVAAVNGAGPGPVSAVASATPAAAGGQPATVVATGFAASTVTGASFTFTGIDVGAGGTVVVAAVSRRNTSSRGAAAISVGGQAATLFARNDYSGNYIRFGYLDGVAAGSVDIEVTMEASQIRAGIHVWVLQNADLGAASVVNIAGGTSGSVNATGDGIVLAAAISVTPASQNIDWTGLDERLEWQDYGDTFGTGAADRVFAADAAGHAVSFATDGALTGFSMLSVPKAG